MSDPLFAAFGLPAALAAVIATFVGAFVSALGRILGGTLLAVAPTKAVLAIALASTAAIYAYSLLVDDSVTRATVFLSGLWAGIVVPYAIALVRAGGRRAFGPPGKPDPGH